MRRRPGRQQTGNPAPCCPPLCLLPSPSAPCLPSSSPLQPPHFIALSPLRSVLSLSPAVSRALLLSGFTPAKGAVSFLSPCRRRQPASQSVYKSPPSPRLSLDFFPSLPISSQDFSHPSPSLSHRKSSLTHPHLSSLAPQHITAPRRRGQSPAFRCHAGRRRLSLLPLRL